jgi:hypothetical protein
MSRRIIALFSLVLDGCIAWATPPIVIAGGGAGAIVDRSDSPARPTPYVFSASLNPLQLFPSLQDRALDFGAGWSVNTGLRASRSFAHGPELGATFFWAHFDGGRLGLTGKGRALFDGEGDPLGFGGTVQVSAELVGFVEDPGSAGKYFNTIGWGEKAIGAYAEASFIDVGPHRIFTAGGGIQFRIPASAGFGGISRGSSLPIP